MRIDAHAHGTHAERDDKGRFRPPLMAAWRQGRGPAQELVKQVRQKGIESFLLLDPPEIAFEMQDLFGDFVIPIPLVNMESTTPEQIAGLFARGAHGIKFIAPQHSYGDSRYFPLYEAVRDHKGLAIFHTGYLVFGGLFDPGGLMGVKDVIDITLMRPAAIDRVARAFPDLKILMSHFGNPWWEETWTVMKAHKNVYADFSGGTAFNKSMAMWREMFAPNGRLHTASLAKLCFASDGSPFFPPDDGFSAAVDFYESFYDTLRLPAELREKIDRGNTLFLLGR